MTATQPIIRYATEDQLLASMAALGFPFPFLHQMSMNGGRRGDATILDYRPLGEPYTAKWVGSVYDQDGDETHRFIVLR